MRTDSYVGQDFFDKWEFFHEADPSNGLVDYVDYDAAVHSHMVGASANEVFMSADTVTVLDSTNDLTGGKGRRSLRLESFKTFQSGLFVIQVKHIPTGCGIWPAFWLFGADRSHEWPAWGEYDLIEGVHEATVVQTALHTSQGCNQSRMVPGEDFNGTWSRGKSKPVADDCFVQAEGQFPNQGCSQNGPANSFGAELNERGGGTFAGEWDPVGKRIRSWFWPNGSEPLDLNNRPNPAQWGIPYSHFTLDNESCSAHHFQNMRMVFSLNLCGDLAEAQFAESCPELAARMSCRELISQHPEALKNAFWTITGLDVFQWQPPPASTSVNSLSLTSQPLSPTQFVETHSMSSEKPSLVLMQASRVLDRESASASEAQMWPVGVFSMQYPVIAFSAFAISMVLVGLNVLVFFRPLRSENRAGAVLPERMPIFRAHFGE